jgi:2-amino-4-hydroxy-6-hydroxymethyldihydropteridine diphosphokinase
MNTVFLGLGGNEGDRLNYLTLTVLSIENEIGKVVALSSIYETSPWGFISKNLFLNQVAKVETSLSPEEILDKIAGIESTLGRERTGKGYLPRTVDIDILLYGQTIIETKNLTIPHPRLPDRLFVLVPLSEIAPDFIHPKLGLAVSTLLKKCSDTSEIWKVEQPESRQ